MTRFGFLSTYPPTRCGLATFTQALASSLTADGADTAVIVRALDAPARIVERVTEGRVPATELIAGDPASLRSASRVLDACDVAVVQHEYGIYGGADGDEVVTLLETLSVPVIAVLHTVLPTPSVHQRTVLEGVCEAADSVVVMTSSARDTLLAVYRVRAGKVVVIPHGVPESQRRDHAPDSRRTRRVLTWGLLSPGKGLEWGIRAMAQLRDLDIEYVIAGQTHPKVLENEGERYREHLESVISQLGLERRVRLDGRYLDSRQLDELVATADVVLLPYESREQATSGVLAEAVGAGIPVVATGFPHALELLTGGAGLIARHADPASLAAAVRTMLERADVGATHAAAPEGARLSTWPVVGEAYRSLAQSIAAVRAA